MSESLCVFGSLGDCAGRLQWHHVVPQQRLKRRFPHGAYRAKLAGEFTQWLPIPRTGLPRDIAPVEMEQTSLRLILRDQRNRANVCAFHHGQVEARRIYVDPSDPVREFAREYGLEAELDQDAVRAGRAA